LASRTLGLHIGQTAVRAALLARGRERVTLTHCAEVAVTPPGAEGRAQALAAALGEIARSLPVRTCTLVAHVPAARAAVRMVESPLGDAARLRQVIRYDVEEQIPFDADEAVADFCPLETLPSGAIRALAVATPREVLDQVTAALGDAGMPPDVVDAEPFALVNACVRAFPSLATDRAIVLYLDAGHHVAVATDNGTPVLCRAVKAQAGDASGAWQRLADEMDLTYRAAFSDSPRARAWRLVLAGEGAERGDLAEFLADALGCETLAFDPASAVHVSDGLDPGPEMAIAMGLALRSGTGTGLGVDLRAAEMQPTLARTQVRRALAASAVLCACLVIVGLTGFLLRLHLQEARYAELGQAMRAEFRAAMGDEPMVLDGLDQLEERAQKARKESAAFREIGLIRVPCVRLLRDISQRIPPAAHVVLSELTIGPATVHLKGTAGAVTSVDDVRIALEGSQLFEDIRPDMWKFDGKRGIVSFGFTLTLRK